MSLGIDISNNNGSVDLAAVKKAHPDLVVVGIKATEGTDFVDAYAARNFEQADKLGLVAQFYHFARPDKHPGTPGGVMEADFFLATIRPMVGHLRVGVPVLDYESAADLDFAEAFCRRVQQKLGYPPIIYCSGSRTAEVASRPFLRSCRLWIAAYGPSYSQYVPSGMHAVLWQYTDRLDGHLDASKVLSFAHLVPPLPPEYLYVSVGTRVVRKIRFGGGRVKAFFGKGLGKMVATGKRITLRRGR